jgi:predicted RND superfamily exporter protein
MRGMITLSPPLMCVFLAEKKKVENLAQIFKYIVEINRSTEPGKKKLNNLIKVINDITKLDFNKDTATNEELANVFINMLNNESQIANYNRKKDPNLDKLKNKLLEIQNELKSL